MCVCVYIRQTFLQPSSLGRRKKIGKVLRRLIRKKVKIEIKLKEFFFLFLLNETFSEYKRAYLLRDEIEEPEGNIFLLANLFSINKLIIEKY